MRISNSAWSPSGSKTVSASRRSDDQKGLLEERKVVSIQFGDKDRQEEEPSDSSTDFADYIIDLHA